jgi:hypothetical protein
MGGGHGKEDNPALEADRVLRQPGSPETENRRPVKEVLK